MKLSPAQVELAFFMKHGDPGHLGPAPRMRRRFGYFTPDNIYEGLVAQLAAQGVSWLDVGGGGELFPENPRLARMLADRSQVLVGVDPSANIQQNPYVHERVECPIEDFRSSRLFDLATMRMVAEHITRPELAIAALARLLRPGGKVVVYTVNRWSPISLFSWLVPFRLHHPIKRLLWHTEEKDTFPVAYAMNTRTELARLFSRGGFRECFFAHLDDCRTFHRFPLLSLAELGLCKVLGAIGLRYPENCLLGVYERLPSPATLAKEEPCHGESPKVDERLSVA